MMGIFQSSRTSGRRILKKFGFSTVKTASTPMETSKPLLKDTEAEDVNTKIHIDNESTICIVKNPIFHSKTKHIEIRHHFIQDSNEKKLIQMIKIHTDQNVADLLTKAFDVTDYTTNDDLNGMKKPPMMKFKLVLLDKLSTGINLLLLVKLMLLGITYYCWATAGSVNAVRLNLVLLVQVNVVEDKPTKSDGFELIVDFLNAHPIKYALIVNPTIYTACIEQFWTTAKVKTVNGEVQIQALLDKKKVIINETSIRRDLQLADENGTECLPNATFLQNWKEWEPMADETENVESVPTHSNYTLLSGEDRLKLNELIELCTNLSQRVLDLENTKTSQAVKNAKLKERVKKLERRNKSRTSRLKRLRKIGRTTRIESSEDKGLGDQEDASKQGKKIIDIDADEEVTLIDETQRRNDDNLMFDTGVLDEQEVEVEKVVSTVEVTTVSATTTTIDELTLAQTLIEIKAAKPKAITTASTTTTTVVTRPKARGVIVQDPSEFTTTTSQPSHLPQAKDKGKANMVEPEKPLKKKDQILIDEEIA
ncbi:hypothetical protein Tco_1143943 [Tanacetum coccineum]